MPSPRKKCSKGKSRSRKTGRCRSPKIKIKISNKGSLTSLGYHYSEPASKRHQALTKAIKKDGKGTIVKRLNAICILNKNKNPSIAEKFCVDKRWVMKNF